MYQVLSQQRPGRPRWALAATGLLLLATLGFAWLIIQQKTRARLLPLQEAQLYPIGELRCRMPAGWKTRPVAQRPDGGDRKSDPSGLILAADEPSEGGARGRKLLVFRGIPRRFGLPSDYSARAVLQLLQRVSPGAKHQDLGPATIGPLPAWTVGAVGDSMGNRRMYFLARAAIAPLGQIIGLMLITADELRREDRDLLEQLSRHVELTTATPADSSKVMAAAGLRFEAPEDAVFFEESLGRVPRVQLSGGHDGGFWYLLANRVPLVAPRTPEALLRDFACTTLRTPEAPGPIESGTIAGRQVFQTRLTMPGDRSPTVLISSAEVAEGTGLLLIGWFEKSAGETLRKLCNRIWETAAVEPYDRFIDRAGGRTAARNWLQELTAKGLASAWGPYDHRSQTYAFRAPAIEFGHETRVFQQDRGSGAAWWEVASRSQYTIVDHEAVERWRIRDDAAAHRLDMRVSLLSGQIHYSEERAAGAPEVRRELSAPGGRSASLTTLIDDTYASSLALLWAAGKMANSSQREPAVFSTTAAFLNEAAYCTLLPLGPTLLPGEQDRRLPAVQFQLDCDPAPLVLYYDASETLRAIAVDDGTWQILIRNGAWGGNDG